MGAMRGKLIKAVAKYARGITGQVTVRQFCESAGVEEGRVHEEFPGGIGELLAAAGLGHRASRRVRVDFGGLMAALDEVAGVIGRVPTPGDMDRIGKVTARTYYSRMGTWGRVRAEYVRWKKRGGKAEAKEAAWRTRGRGAPERGEVVGEPLTLERMRYAPTSESAVVYLFGVMARELGFVVEHVGAAFPDCRALRVRDGAWSRVRVEFELRSSNFRVHGHDPAGCDVVVCWEHDWAECPLEVVELRKEVEKMEAGRRGGGQGLAVVGVSAAVADEGAAHSGQRALMGRPRRS